MSPLSSILSFCCLYIIISSTVTVNANVEILDPFGRSVATFLDSESFYDKDIETVEGFIVMTEPPGACLPVEEPHFLANFSDVRIALINGSDACEYKTKVNNAGRAHFGFAIIFDPPATPFGIYYFGEKHIPAVVISYEDGLIIKDNYLFNHSSNYNYRIRVKHEIGNLSLVACIVLSATLAAFALCLLNMICRMLYFFCKACIEHLRLIRAIRRNAAVSGDATIAESSSTERNWNLLSRCQIEQLPAANFSKGDQYDICAICLEIYLVGDKLRILPCSHAYHAKCIDHWLMDRFRNCPLCKGRVSIGGSEDERNSELSSHDENTPLLASPFNWDQSWEAIVRRSRTVNHFVSERPSSLPDNFFFTTTEHLRLLQSEFLADDNLLATDSESKSLVAPSNFSVNTENVEGSTSEVEVPFSFDNPFDRLATDSESESLLPPSFSVNTEEVEGATSEVEVHVSIDNPFEVGSSPNHAEIT